MARKGWFGGRANRRQKQRIRQHRRRTWRRLTMESLEDRRLLASDIAHYELLDDGGVASDEGASDPTVQAASLPANPVSGPSLIEPPENGGLDGVATQTWPHWPTPQGNSGPLDQTPLANSFSSFPLGNFPFTPLGAMPTWPFSPNSLGANASSTTTDEYGHHCGAFYGGFIWGGFFAFPYSWPGPNPFPSPRPTPPTPTPGPTPPAPAPTPPANSAPFAINDQVPLELSLVDEGNPQLIVAILNDHRLTLTPRRDAHGKTRLTIRAVDAEGDSQDADVVVNVKPQNDVPIQLIDRLVITAMENCFGFISCHN